MLKVDGVEGRFISNCVTYICFLPFSVMRPRIRPIFLFDHGNWMPGHKGRVAPDLGNTAPMSLYEPCYRMVTRVAPQRGRVSNGSSLGMTFNRPYCCSVVLQSQLVNANRVVDARVRHRVRSIYVVDTRIRGSSL